MRISISLIAKTSSQLVWIYFDLQHQTSLVGVVQYKHHRYQRPSNIFPKYGNYGTIIEDMEIVQIYIYFFFQEKNSSRGNSV